MLESRAGAGPADTDAAESLLNGLSSWSQVLAAGLTEILQETRPDLVHIFVDPAAQFRRACSDPGRRPSTLSRVDFPSTVAGDGSALGWTGRALAALCRCRGAVSAPRSWMSRAHPVRPPGRRNPQHRRGSGRPGIGACRLWGRGSGLRVRIALGAQEGATGSSRSFFRGAQAWAPTPTPKGWRWADAASLVGAPRRA